MDSPPVYPHLAVELRALTGDALLLWGDAAARRAAIEAVVAAWLAEDTALDAAIARVDGAVVAGLAALGLPRGPVRAVRVEPAVRGWIGQKARTCELLLDGIAMRSVLKDPLGANRMFHTWVHESLHARPLVEQATWSESRHYPGYEEGMVEGLTRFATRTCAAMTLPMLNFDYYVEAYRTLAIVLGCDVQHLWRVQWEHPRGAVRSMFAEVVADWARSTSGRPFTATQLNRLQVIGDHCFGLDRGAWIPRARTLEALWRAGLK